MGTFHPHLQRLIIYKSVHTGQHPCNQLTQNPKPHGCSTVQGHCHVLWQLPACSINTTNMLLQLQLIKIAVNPVVHHVMSTMHTCSTLGFTQQVDGSRDVVFNPDTARAPIARCLWQSGCIRHPSLLSMRLPWPAPGLLKTSSCSCNTQAQQQ